MGCVVVCENNLRLYLGHIIRLGIVVCTTGSEQTHIGWCHQRVRLRYAVGTSIPLVSVAVTTATCVSDACLLRSYVRELLVEAVVEFGAVGLLHVHSASTKSVVGDH